MGSKAVLLSMPREHNPSIFSPVCLTLTTCSSLPSIAVPNTLTSPTLGRKEFIQVTSPRSHSSSVRDPSWNSGQEAEGRGLSTGGTLLTGLLLWPLLSLLYYIVQNFLPRGSTVYSGLDPPPPLRQIQIPEKHGHRPGQRRQFPS